MCHLKVGGNAILEDISSHIIAAGQTLGIMGPTGSRKDLRGESAGALL